MDVGRAGMLTPAIPVHIVGSQHGGQSWGHTERMRLTGEQDREGIQAKAAVSCALTGV